MISHFLDFPKVSKTFLIKISLAKTSPTKALATTPLFNPYAMLTSLVHLHLKTHLWLINPSLMVRKISKYNLQFVEGWKAIMDEILEA